MFSSNNFRLLYLNLFFFALYLECSPGLFMGEGVASLHEIHTASEQTCVGSRAQTENGHFRVTSAFNLTQQELLSCCVCH